MSMFRYLIVLLTLGCLTTKGTSQTLIRSGEDPVKCQLSRIEDDWTVILNAGEKSIRVVPSELYYWGAVPTRAEYHRIVLRDGSQLHADVLSITDDTVRIDSRLWQRQTLPLSEVAAIIFDVRGDLLQRSLEHKSILEGDSPAIIWLTNNDRLDATLIRIPTNETDRKKGKRPVTLNSEGREFEIPFQSIKAIRQSGVVTSLRLRTKATVGFSDGSVLEVSRINHVGDQLELQTSAGVSLVATSNARSFWSIVTMIQSRNKSATYLSELEPIRTKNAGMFEADFPVQKNSSATGGPLLMRKNSYLLNGIGMHATSNIVFGIPKGSKRFATEIGIDGSSGDGGSVVLKVFLLKAGKWQEAFKSKVIRGGENIVPVSVAIEDESAIALVVDQSERGDVLDRANLFYARFESK